MGQKVNPKVFRLKIVDSWDSFWYCKKNYSYKLYEDIRIRKLIYDKYNFLGLGQIKIERLANRVTINISYSKTNSVLLKKKVDISNLKFLISKITRNIIIINLYEIKKPEINSFLISHFVAQQLEKRVSFRKILKKVISDAISSGAMGIKILLSGRLGGAEIARNEAYKYGKIPLHTIRAAISYSKIQAKTIYGIIGVKVWVYQGERINK